MSDTERRRNVGAEKGSSQSHALIRIDMKTKIHIPNRVGQPGLHRGHTHTSPNQLNARDVRHCQIGRLHCSRDRNGSPLGQISAEFLELGTRDVHGQCHVIVQRVHVNRDFVVGRQDVLHLICLKTNLCHCARNISDILLVTTCVTPFSVEVVGHVFYQTIIKGLSSQSLVPRLSQDLNGSDGLCLLRILSLGHLIRVELDHTYLQGASTQIVEDEDLGFLVLLVHSKVQGCSGVFVDQTQNIEICHLGSVQKGLTFCLSGK
mmetsp:Transcript_97526/g.146148  ORF Transcript_97526/g.146148 Transcript_97526/m.146148 type:complete len:262 (-) Transcript_97526:640-1425(-)